ncbi:MAG: type II toxin-antitoxin system VapC family toxin [Micromonosporaceae bacterium]
MILVDSDVLIAHLRGMSEATKWLLDVRSSVGPLHISVVTVTEITGGMRAHEKRQVWRLLGSLRVEDVNEVVARRAGEFTRRFRASHGAIGLGDYLIAATADVRGYELATLNVRHFPMFTGLRAPFRIGGGGDK